MKRLISFFLVFTLFIGMFPTALAADSSSEEGDAAPETSGYILSDITIDPDSPEATVELATADPATVIVAMFAETGAMVGVGMAEVAASEEMQQIPVELHMSTGRPAYFSLRAFLLGDWFVPLCESLRCFTYTRGFAEFQDVTAEDFPNQKALEGEDNNLLVLAPGVIELTAGKQFTSLSVDEENSLYTLSGASGAALTLQKGDSVWMVDENGIQHSVKAASVSQNSTTVTITGSEDSQVSDFVSFIRLDVLVDQEDVDPYVDDAEPVQLNSAVPENPGTDVVEKKELSLGGEYKPATGLSLGISTKISMETRTSVYYSPDHLDSKELYVKIKETLGVSISVSATGALNNNVNGKEFEINLSPEIRVPIYTGVEFKFKVSVPILVELQGTASLSWEQKGSITCVYQNGVHATHATTQNQEPDPNFDLKAKATIRVGLRITLGIELLRALDLSLKPEGGIEATGNIDPTVGSPTTGRWHKCALCIDGNISVYFKAGLSLKLGFGKWKYTIFDITFFNNRAEYGKFHVSSSNGFAWGACDNFEYRLRVFVIDNEGRNLTMAKTKVFNMEDFAEGSSGMVDYLRPGEYTMETVCSAYQTNYEPDERTLVMGKQAQDVTVTLLEVGEEPPTVGDIITSNVYFEFSAMHNEESVKSYMILRPNGLLTFQEDEPEEYASSYPQKWGAYTYWRNDYKGAIYWKRLNAIKQAVWLDNSMTVLPKDSFSGAPQLTNVDFNGTAMDIGYGAFHQCKLLTSVKNTSNVKAVGDLAFWGSGITEIDLPGAETIGREAFAFCKDLERVQLGSCTIGNSAFYGCISLREINLSGVKEIGNSAFAGCGNLKVASIPNDTSKIGECAFQDTGLEDITIPAGVTELNMKTFSGCSSLQTVNLPDGLQSLGNNAFAGCTSLATIELPDTVTSLGYNAFSDCVSLEEIYIPAGVEELDPSNFYNCWSLRTIRFGGTMEQWQALLAKSYNSLDTTYITVHCIDGTIPAANA